MRTVFEEAAGLAKEVRIECRRACDGNVNQRTRDEAAARARALASKLAIMVAEAAVPSAVYYFGCMGRVGHYLHTPDGRTAYRVKTPWARLDGTLCPGAAEAIDKHEYVPRSKQVEGRAILHHRDGWTALAFWDRSVDDRYQSNSAFLAEGTFDFGQMVDIARTRFPQVCGRFTFDVVLDGVIE